jgi:hypothetical protein
MASKLLSELTELEGKRPKAASKAGAKAKAESKAKAGGKSAPKDTGAIYATHTPFVGCLHLPSTGALNN